MKSARKTKASDGTSVKHGEGSYGKAAASVKYSGLKDFARRFVDCDEFISHIQDWLLFKLDSSDQQFREPFHLDELKQLDYALEGVIFQQLLRMPYWQPGARGSVEAEIHLAVEDFLHTIAQTLWETLYSSEDRMPFFVTGPRGSTKIKRGLEGVALVGKNGRGHNTVWEHVVEFVEIQPEIGGETGSAVSTIVGRTLFHGIHMLMSRLYTDKKPSVRRHIDTAYVLFVDSKCGGVMRLRGDISKLETKTGGLCYEMAAAWLEKYADVTVSSVEQVWNRFGNANWGDLGALQLILATLFCIEQCRGSPRRSLAELAADHGSRLHRRKIERRFLEIQENGIDHVYHQEHQSEIQEIEELEARQMMVMRDMEPMKLEQGTVLWLEDGHRQSGFQIMSVLGDDKYSVYSATPLDDKSKALMVYVGSHPSQVEPSWEDMTTWYQVQRQTKVLSLMKQKGVSSKNLAQLVTTGRILHPGTCTRQSPGGRCDHPWCGIPVLVTSPLGEPLDLVVAKTGWLSAEEALRCCHDVLSALRSVGSAGIQHGDLGPRHIIRTTGNGSSEPSYVLVDWGRAVLEDRDAPALSPRYSSTYALQEGKLCPASDAESLVYLLFFLVGGSMPEFESMESALQWRERAWGLRTFQLLLGEVSTVLKAYADYIDSLIGTPYPADYDIWLRRLSRAIQSENSSSTSLGKQRVCYIEAGASASSPSAAARHFDYNTAESSGTS